jgi:hypothetical protein
LKGTTLVVDKSVMGRTLRTLWLGVGLVVGSVVAWTTWAEIEYGSSPQAGCPFGTSRAAPWWPLAVALSVGSAAAMGWALWRKHLRPQAVVVGVLTGAVAFVAILVALVFVAAPLRCFD